MNVMEMYWMFCTIGLFTAISFFGGLWLLNRLSPADDVVR